MFEQFLPVCIICIIALPWKSIKNFSLCRYKVITFGRRYSGKQIVQVYGLTSEKLKLLTDAEFAELEFPPD